MARSSPWLALALFVVTLITFWPLSEAGFVNYDDPGYVYENSQVAAGLTADGAVWAFTTFHKANWHPLTWLSHMLDVEWFGMDPGAHHLVNVLLHAINAVLLLAFLVQTTGRPVPAFFVAAFFALHPLHVESVAWVSERKDVLSTFFWFLGLHAYVLWVRGRGLAPYALVVGALLCGLLAKPMVVTFPCVLVLLDVWPLGRTRWAPAARGSPVPPVGWRTLLAEKLPLFALVALASVLTVRAQSAGGAVIAIPALSVPSRLANAAVGYLWYLEKALWPRGLAVLYPHPGLAGAEIGGVGEWLPMLAGLVGITLVCLRFLFRRPYLAVGWLWYLGTLVPVIGLVQVGAQATADRYSYVPLVGVFLALAWAVADWTGDARGRRFAAVGAASGLLLASAVLTRHQLVHWRSARSLAQRSVDVTQDNYVMLYNLGLAAQQEGDLESARQHYQEAVHLRPREARFHTNLGTVLAALGAPLEARARYARAIELAPGHPEAANNLAWLLATHPDPAVRDGSDALEVAQRALAAAGPGNAQILDTLAAAQAETGQFAAAVQTSQQAARLARESGQRALSTVIEERIAAYQRGLPWRERPGVTADLPLQRPGGSG